MTMGMSDRSDRSRILVAFFSRSGNTGIVARGIRELTGAHLFEIVPVDSYPEGYQEVVDQARKEIRAGYHPELKSENISLNEYDVIFIGSPNWLNTVAPPVSTFLAGHDLSGKTLIPFMTHGGSGLGTSVTDIRRLCPGAVVLEALAVRGNRSAE